MNDEKKYFEAIRDGNSKIIEEMFLAGFNNKTSDSHGNNGLILAIRHSQFQIFELLLKLKVDPYLKNFQKVSAFDIAQNNQFVNLLILITKYAPKDKKRIKKGKFSGGKSTRNVHLEYLEYPQDYEFESLYLEDTIELISEDVNNRKNKIKLGDLGGADNRTNELLAIRNHKKVNQLIEKQKQPYFGRVDVERKDGVIESIYLGSMNLLDDRVYASQSPFGSLYAQRKLGKVIDSFLGEINVLLIRQIENIQGVIKNIVDVSFSEEEGYLDPILLNQLNKKAQNQLNEIWSTIQAEQDLVVRQDINKPIIVQGSAGSGKTIIALHRLSYILHNFKQLEAKKIMILGPNTMFLQYIRETLPHLHIDDVYQATFETFAKERLPIDKNKYSLVDYFTFYEENHSNEIYNIINKKGSLKFQQTLKDFLNYFAMEHLPKNGIFVSSRFGEFSFSREKVQAKFKEFLASSNIMQARERTLEVIKSEFERFIQGLWTYREKFYKEVVQFVQLINNEIQNLYKEWVEPTLFNVYEKFLYSSFLEEIDIDLTIFRKHHLYISKKLLYYDDLAPLLYIQQWLVGNIGVKDNEVTKHKFHYLVIDEAQDYSPFQISLLQSLVSNNRIMLLGDLGQSIFEPRGISDWKELNNILTLEEWEMITLSKIYRSTMQIVTFAQSLITNFSKNRFELSNPIGRDGVEPNCIKFTSNIEQVNGIISLISEAEENEYEKIAIVVKNSHEATILYNELQKENKKIRLITSPIDQYNNGIVIIPIHLTKGMEYDVVLFGDASIEKYEDTEYNRKLFYVGITRALHVVTVLYKDSLSLPLLEIFDPKLFEEKKIEIENKRLLEETVTKNYSDHSNFNYMEIDEHSLDENLIQTSINTVFKEMTNLVSIYKKRVNILENKVIELENENNSLKSLIENIKDKVEKVQ